jgi:hypothetical protein
MQRLLGKAGKGISHGKRVSREEKSEFSVVVDSGY